MRSSFACENVFQAITQRKYMCRQENKFWWQWCLLHWDTLFYLKITSCLKWKKGDEASNIWNERQYSKLQNILWEESLKRRWPFWHAKWQKSLKEDSFSSFYIFSQQKCSFQWLMICSWKEAELLVNYLSCRLGT